jgi:hypothetical protein
VSFGYSLLPSAVSHCHIFMSGCPIFLHTRRQEFELMQGLSALGKAQKLRSATIKTPQDARAESADLEEMSQTTAALEGPETSACGMKYVEMGELLRSVLVL